MNTAMDRGTGNCACAAAPLHGCDTWIFTIYCEGNNPRYLQFQYRLFHTPEFALIPFTTNERRSQKLTFHL